MGKVYYGSEAKTLSLEVHTKELLPAQESDLESNYPKSHLEENLKRWPAEPQAISHKRSISVALAAYDVALCLVPILLLVKAGLCVYAANLDRNWKGPFIDSASELSRNLVQFNAQLTTLFTICFVLIISTTVRRYALFKAERGATLGELEQYQASISLPSTLRAIWSLRAYTLRSLGLLLVWSWYYVGSQAAQREYSLQESSPYRDFQIARLADTLKSPFEDASYENITKVQRTDMTAQYHVYTKKVETASVTMGSDVSGNALVPIYDNDWVPGKKGWISVKAIDGFGLYTSAIGDTCYVKTDPGTGHITTDEKSNNWTSMPLVGSFNYETSYFRTSCSNMTLSEQNLRPAGMLPSMTMSLNMSTQARPDPDHSGRIMDFFNNFNETHSVHASCAITKVNVEVNVHCLASGCKVVRMRHSTTKPAELTQTPFDEDRFASKFLNALLLACGVPQSTDDTTTFERDNGLEGFAADVNRTNVLSGTDLEAEMQRLMTRYAGEISAVITRHINTFYAASKLIKLVAKAGNKDVKERVILKDDPDFQFSTMNGEAYEAQYLLCLPWLAVDIVSCLVLLTAAIWGFWLRENTLVPDIFGYVSSLTRENPHLDIAGGSTLSGLDRARRMKHVKVQIGEVGSETGASKVGLTYIGDGEKRASNLAKDKRYM